MASQTFHQGAARIKDVFLYAQFGQVGSKRESEVDYVFESRAARNRSVFATANAALVSQNPSGGVQFQRIGAEKGDSSLNIQSHGDVAPSLPARVNQIQSADGKVFG